MSNTYKDLPWPILHLHEVAGKLSEAIDAAEPLLERFDIDGKPAHHLVHKMDEIRWAILHAEGELLARAAERAKTKKKP